jgi:hypothetical protein
MTTLLARSFVYTKDRKEIEPVMPTTAATPTASGHPVDDEVAGGCAVCPHPGEFHDRIAARYCTATVAGKFSRGCVCTAYPDDTGPHQNNKDKDA